MEDGSGTCFGSGEGLTTIGGNGGGGAGGTAGGGVTRFLEESLEQVTVAFAEVVLAVKMQKAN